jgi:hypothetical protein
MVVKCVVTTRLGVSIEVLVLVGASHSNLGVAPVVIKPILEADTVSISSDSVEEGTFPLVWCSGGSPASSSCSWLIEIHRENVLPEQLTIIFIIIGSQAAGLGGFVTGQGRIEGGAVKRLPSLGMRDVNGHALARHGRE